MYLRSLVSPIAENEAIERLQRHHVGSHSHVRLSATGSKTQTAEASQDTLNIMAWCYAFLDTHPAPQQLTTWREVFEWHSISSDVFFSAHNSAPLPDSATGGLVAHVRAIAAQSVSSSVASLGELELHTSLAALGFTHAVSPEQARRFVRWCANKAMFRASADEFHAPLVLSLSSPQAYVFTVPTHPVTPEWVRFYADPPETAAVSAFYTSMVGTAISPRMRTAVLPEQAAAALRLLECDVVERSGASDEALAVASQLWDPTPKAPLHDLKTAIDAAQAISR